jgi:glutathione-independent formaldehyde dehydrogenase
MDGASQPCSVITLDQAPQGYADFDKGVARKFVIDPHGLPGTGTGA